VFHCAVFLSISSAEIIKGLRQLGRKMLFSSPFFIFFFLPIFLILFLTSGARYRDYVLLFCSLGFYFWGEPSFCLIAIGSSLFDYWLCNKIFAVKSTKQSAKLYLVVGVLANLALLIYFKYTNFFINSFVQLISGGQHHFELLNIILPIGVSFIVFEKITYLVDVYRGNGKPANRLLNYLNYVFLFPKLLAGPIIKYHEIEQQLANRDLQIEDILEGFKRFIVGLIKKVLIADTCSEVVNHIFALPAESLGFSYAWLGIICFTLQIYFDFSGYSDMALGLARMMGFRLRENFNMPYIATSLTDFWRRWHISLSSWIREYLYIPLGGSRASQIRMYTNLWICFLLSGLWHGANWTFVLWGLYNGLFLITDKLFWLKISQKMPRVISISITLMIIMIGWVIFRSTDFKQVKFYLAALFQPALPNHNYLDMTSNMKVAIWVGASLALAGMVPSYERLQFAYKNWTWRQPVEGYLYGALGLFAISKIVGVTFMPFLYFRF
jgi:alginate O-acetyltransferase complex protein AlgI